MDGDWDGGFCVYEAERSKKKDLRVTLLIWC